MQQNQIKLLLKLFLTGLIDYILNTKNYKDSLPLSFI